LYGIDGARKGGDGPFFFNQWHGSLLLIFIQETVEGSIQTVAEESLESLGFTTVLLAITLTARV
jgi:hypothetical protein